jgi:hypothetical protein
VLRRRRAAAPAPSSIAPGAALLIHRSTQLENRRSRRSGRKLAGGERGRGLRLLRRRPAGSGHVRTNGCSGTAGGFLAGRRRWAAGRWRRSRGGVMAGREMGRQASFGKRWGLQPTSAVGPDVMSGTTP